MISVKTLLLCTEEFSRYVGDGNFLCTWSVSLHCAVSSKWHRDMVLFSDRWTHINNGGRCSQIFL
ncbi:hypothetical protein INR49_025008 [Caranx melampygus]|nr:hypothetical protein INR49_025008 [Caranx melampygus]